MKKRTALEAAIESAYQYVKAHLYHEGTRLIYDHRLEDMTRLPTREEAERSFPNPCGYGTGMEDSVINGSGMIDALLHRVAAYHEEEDRAFLHDLVDGLLQTAEAGRDGFLPRSRIPSDGVSHYIDSSRDQYTLFLYAMCRYTASGEATAEELERIRCAVLRIAERAVRNVTPENGYDLLREDGGRSLVTTMWGEIGNHEMPRLPMLYLLAYHLGGDEAYLARYRALREEMLARLLPMGHYWAAYCVAQMQMALYVIRALDPDIDFSIKIDTVMGDIAAFCTTALPEYREKLQRKQDFRGSFLSFRDLPLVQRKGQVDGGLPNLAPVREGFDVFYNLQDAANLLFTAALSGRRALCVEPLAFMEQTLCALDLKKHVTGAPVQYLQAYYTWRNIQ